MNTKLTESFADKKSATEPMDTLLEVNENVVSEIFDRPFEEEVFEEIDPKIFSLKNITEPLTISALNNAIYELGVVDLCWPEITEPVFETRTCFPKSYYTNSTKERLLLAYTENFRRQFQFHFRARKPLFFQAPNECGLQKMVCTSIRPTKLCYAHTNTWQGVASLVADFFDYEPLTKCMLHVQIIIYNNWTQDGVTHSFWNYTPFRVIPTLLQPFLLLIMIGNLGVFQALFM